MRIDKFLAEKHHFSRNKIQQFIEAKLIVKNKKIVTKASEKVADTDEIIILEDRRTEWVSRSAEKLFGFFEKSENTTFKNLVPESICLDVGASTGGFSQVLLYFWAKQVDAVDVGSNQLSQTLRENPKITSFEQTDIRNFSSKNVPYDIIVCDASFISLEKILLDIIQFADKKTLIIVLLKPQFEVEKNLLNKNGVPKNEKIIQNVMEKFENFLKIQNILCIQKEKSILTWEAGNQEWLYILQK